MILLDVDQGSAEWHAARLGVATASCADKIITPGGKVSSSRDVYAAELAGELVAGKREDIYVNEWMLRGIELEPQARLLYEMITDTTVDTVGFCFMDEFETIGCSPDGLLSEDGGLEIKCPKLSTHMLYLLAGNCPPKYIPQVQFSMMVTGRKWWDFMSYHPDVKPLITRVKRDDEFINTLENLTVNTIGLRDTLLEIINAKPK